MCSIVQRESETLILWESVEILPFASALPGLHFASLLQRTRDALCN